MCLALAPLCAAKDWNYQDTRHDSREFVSGGSVHVHMTVGSVRIKHGDADKIRLEYTVKSRREDNVKDTRVDFDVRGNDATLEFHSPSNGNTNIDVTIEVPPNTNLDVHEKVGDVTIDRIEGDKDLELGVGDIRVTTDHARYKLVRADCGVGDVHSNGYGQTSGWLGKSLKYRGDGKYELRAHVGVGDIHLEGE